VADAAMLSQSASARDIPRLIQETPTGRLSVRQVFPPRRAMARGRGATIFVAMALGAFALLFTLVRRNRSRLFDLHVTRSLQRVGVPGFDRLMRLVSWPGFPPQSRLIPPTLALGWLLLGFPIEAAFQLLAWGAGAISAIVKIAMGRPRPAPEDVRVVPGRIGGSSFPSGHVLIYSGVYGFLAFLIETLVRSNTLRRTATAVLVGLISLVGPSRIYLGHHWFTDVLASYLLGSSYLLALMALYRRVKTRWLNRRREALFNAAPLPADGVVVPNSWTGRQPPITIHQ
jgi:undecaprenyl-diphosphatase